MELDLKPRDIMTQEAFENAMVMVMAWGVYQCRIASAGHRPRLTSANN